MPFPLFIQSIWGLVYTLGSVVIHIFFALAVLSDSVKIQERGQRVVFVSGKIWALATFFGGILIAIGYWVIHHSTLRSSSDSAPLE